MRDSLEFEECIIGLHTLDIDLVGTIFWVFEIEVVSSLIVVDLIRISTSIIHRMRDVDSFFFRELEVDLTELRSLVSYTCTVRIRDEVCMIDLMVLVSVLLIIILWKWWHISESDELRSLQFSYNRELSLSLEYDFESVLGNDILLSTILHERIVDIIAHGECHVGRNRPWSGCPGEHTRPTRELVIRFEGELHRDRRIVDLLIGVIHRDLEVGDRSSELP